MQEASEALAVLEEFCVCCCDSERTHHHLMRLNKIVLSEIPTGHSSFVIHLDWAVDSTYLRSCSGDYELLYWNALVCRQVTNMSITRDLKWHTQTCTIGFSVYGIWPENADGTDINTCSRSHSGRLLATGDDFGKVRLFSYPASLPKCLSHMYGGHSSHVTAVDFLPDDNRLISLGGRDCAVLQWAVV
ncbi:hypothetical protein MRX96_048493 [Rhipicephalus microplus]